MNCQNTLDFCIGLGETFAPTIYWGLDTLTSKPITGISQTAPAVVTVTAHGVPTGWRVAVVSAKGMTRINAQNYPPRGEDWHQATSLTANTLQLDDVNSADYQAYTSGGFLVYDSPADLTGITVQMVIRDAPDTGTTLATLTNTSGITLDNTAKTIIPRLETSALTWTTGYYTLDVTNTATGKITRILSGVITLQ